MHVAFSALLAEGRPFLGTFIQSAAPEFVEAAGYAGFRFLTVDLEHTYYGPGSCWINWNTKTFVNWPGQCSPWVVQCSYCYGGRTYTVKSLLSWIKPATDFQQPVIYLDPRNPVHAYVDMDTIKWELSSF